MVEQIIMNLNFAGFRRPVTNVTSISATYVKGVETTQPRTGMPGMPWLHRAEM